MRQEDYQTLVEFANRPWAFNVECRAHCVERPFENADAKAPVKLVIFDFDGALTLYTFMPEERVMCKAVEPQEDPRCSNDLHFVANDAVRKRYVPLRRSGSVACLEVEYNFESPYVANRVQELGHALQCLANDPETGQRPW